MFIKPNTKPQKAPPIPNKVILAAVARKVIKAASRLFTSFMAFTRLPAIVPNKVSPLNSS